jgi:hypothetical protein
MEDMILKSKHYVIFLSIIPSHQIDFHTWWESDNNIALVIDNDILLDRNAYYFFGPYGEYGSFDVPANHNIKKILYQKDHGGYIKSLDVDDNLKKGLLEYFDNDKVKFKPDDTPLTEINIDKLNIEGEMDMREIVYFDRIDLKKYLLGLKFKNKEDYNSMKKYIPKNIKIFV